jgi:hypothetical protein
MIKQWAQTSCEETCSKHRWPSNCCRPPQFKRQAVSCDCCWTGCSTCAGLVHPLAVMLPPNAAGLPQAGQPQLLLHCAVHCAAALRTALRCCTAHCTVRRMHGQRWLCKQDSVCQLAPVMQQDPVWSSPRSVELGTWLLRTELLIGMAGLLGLRTLWMVDALAG